jgi:hypothetical protein
VSNVLNPLIQNHHLVEALWSAVNTSSGSLVNVAPLIKQILETGAWKKREVVQLGPGTVIEFSRFIDFIETPPLKGCGWTQELVEPLIKEDAETLAMWHRAITPPVGINQFTLPEGSHNVTTLRGNKRAYALDRLKREFPKLFDKVVAKELSANAAAIKAGFRKPPNPFKQIKKLLPKLSRDELVEIQTMVTECLAKKN